MTLPQEVYPAMQRSSRQKAQKQAKEPMVMRPFYLLPAFLLLLIFFVTPALVTVVISFTDWRLDSPDIQFVGIDNYVELFTDDDYRKSLFNTLKLDSICGSPLVFAGAGNCLSNQQSDSIKSLLANRLFLARHHDVGRDVYGLAMDFASSIWRGYTTVAIPWLWVN